MGPHGSTETTLIISMADVRALLKAKRSEQRITHPFAAYSAKGDLRCTACGTVVKHASAWSGHVGSKAHRVNVARVKEEEMKKAKEEEERKRKLEEEDEGSEDERGAKRQRTDGEGEEEEDGVNGKENANGSGPGFPANFFSDPSRQIPIGEDDSDDEEANRPPKPATTTQPASQIDLEWAKFQETVVNASAIEASELAHEKYAQATVFAEPELIDEVPEGFPPSVVNQQQQEQEVEDTPKDEEEKRRKKEEDERELIMDRLLDEERAQEEADERVIALKARVDLIKQRRAAAKSQKK